MDKLGVFSGAPGILEPWQAVVRGAARPQPYFPRAALCALRVVWGTWRF